MNKNIVENILKPLDGYLAQIKRNTINGWYEIEVGLPKDWVYKDTALIAYDEIVKNKDGVLLKIYPKKDSIYIDDLIEFVRLIIETNEKIVEKEMEFKETINQVKKDLEEQTNKVKKDLEEKTKIFYDELDKMKEISFNEFDEKLNETTKNKDDIETSEIIEEKDNTTDSKIVPTKKRGRKPKKVKLPDDGE